MKEKANLGFLKELKKPTKSSPKETFSYSRPISKIDQIQNMGLNSRRREHKSVPVDKTTNFSVEQNNAKQSHKGK